MFRLLRSILLLAILAVIAVMAYNYSMGRGFTLSYPVGPGLDADAARKRGDELTKDAAQKAGEAATKIEQAVGEGAVTAKIKSKMALDDHVKARAIEWTRRGLSSRSAASSSPATSASAPCGWRATPRASRR